MNKYIFKSCSDIGLYPIVDSSKWVADLAQYGVKTVQLRIKSNNPDLIEAEIEKSIKIARENAVKLFINDHWLLAIKHQAYGVHLGQDDLITADTKVIWQSGLMLGISTHSYAELANGLNYNPSYIALGPIFPTTSKVMPFAPQGLARLQEWKSMIECPLVAIGGINLDNINAILALGQTNIALISAITQAENPEQITKLLLQRINDAKQ